MFHKPQKAILNELLMFFFFDLLHLQFGDSTPENQIRQSVKQVDKIRETFEFLIHSFPCSQYSGCYTLFKDEN